MTCRPYKTVNLPRTAQSQDIGSARSPPATAQSKTIIRIIPSIDSCLEPVVKKGCNGSNHVITKKVKGTIKEER
jgi:hypothetical protein